MHVKDSDLVCLNCIHFAKKCKTTEIVLYFQFSLYPYKIKIVKYFYYFRFCVK